MIPPGFAVPRGFVVVNDVDEQAIPAEGMPEGWTFIAVRRKTGNTNTRDKYWYSPKKSYKFNAAVKVRRFLAVLDQVGGDEDVAYRLYLKKGRNGGSGDPKTVTNTHKASICASTLDIGSNECGKRSIDVTNAVTDKRSPAERPRLPRKKPQTAVVMPPVSMVPLGFVVEQSPAVPTKKQPPELSMTMSAIRSREWRAKKKKDREEEEVESTKRRDGGGGESSSSIVGRRQGLVVTPPPPSSYKGRQDDVVDPRHTTIAMVSTFSNSRRPTSTPKRKAFVNACNGIRTSSVLRDIDADGNENVERNIIISPPSNNANTAAGNTGGMKLVRVICGGISIKPPNIQQISGWSDEIHQRKKPPSSSQSGPFSDEFNWSPITLVRSPMKPTKKMRMTLPSVLEDEPLSFEEGAALIPSNIYPYSDETGNNMSHGGVLTMRVLLPAVDDSTCPQEGGRITHSTPAQSISKTMFSPITAPLLHESPRGIMRTIHDDDDNACTPNPIKYQNFSSSSGYTPNNTYFGSNESSPSVDMVDLLDCLGGMIA